MKTISYQKPFFIFVTLISVMDISCAKKKKKVTGSGLNTAQNISTGISSPDQIVTLKTENGSLEVGAGAFLNTTVVTLRVMSSAEFNSATNLSLEEDQILSAIDIEARLQSNDELEDPDSGLGVKIFIESSTSLGSDTAAIVFVTDADELKRIFYVDHTSLEATLNSESSQKEVQIGIVKASKFSIALVDGLSQSVLETSFQPLSTDGDVSYLASLPQTAPISMSFTDTDPNGGELGGTISISPPTEKYFLTYNLYWGSNSTEKLNTSPFATLASTDPLNAYTLPADTTIPDLASRFLAFVANANGEMTVGVSTPISDISVPIHAAAGVSFTDGDTSTGEISGDVTITKAGNESDVSHYVLYWGSNSTTKQNGTPIASIAVTGSNVTHSFAANTTIPTSPAATHLLVFTKNSDGEMASSVNFAISDNTGGSCPGGTTMYGTFCWVKSAAFQSCGAKCTFMGLTQDTSALVNFAGSGAGDNDNCKFVVDAIEGGNNVVTENGHASCTGGIGCATDGADFFRCTSVTTTGAAAATGVSRYCACQSL